MRVCSALVGAFLAHGLSARAAHADAITQEEAGSEVLGTLVVQVEKQRRFGAEDRDPRRSRPARWVGVRVDGRMVGFTNWSGTWDGGLPAGHYRVRATGLQNIRNVYLVDVQAQQESFLPMAHNRPLYQEIILSSPEFLFGLFLGSASR